MLSQPRQRPHRRRRFLQSAEGLNPRCWKWTKYASEERTSLILKQQYGLKTLEERLTGFRWNSTGKTEETGALKKENRQQRELWTL
jgi:hypothetical protein